MSGALSKLGNILTMPSPSHPREKAPQRPGTGPLTTGRTPPLPTVRSPHSRDEQRLGMRSRSGPHGAAQRQSRGWGGSASALISPTGS